MVAPNFDGKVRHIWGWVGIVGGLFGTAAALTAVRPYGLTDGRPFAALGPDGRHACGIADEDDRSACGLTDEDDRSACGLTDEDDRSACGLTDGGKSR